MKQFQMQLMPPLSLGENLTDKLLEEFKEKQEEELTEKIISILESKGYKVTPPPKQVKDEYTFARAWDLYQKKVGCKEKLPTFFWYKELGKTKSSVALHHQFQPMSLHLKSVSLSPRQR